MPGSHSDVSPTSTPAPSSSPTVRPSPAQQQPSSSFLRDTTLIKPTDLPFTRSSESARLPGPAQKEVSGEAADDEADHDHLSGVRSDDDDDEDPKSFFAIGSPEFSTVSIPVPPPAAVTSDQPAQPMNKGKVKGGVGFSSTVQVQPNSPSGQPTSGNLYDDEMSNPPVPSYDPSGRASPASQREFDPSSMSFYGGGGERPGYARSESEASTLSVDEMGEDEDVLYDWDGEEDLVDQEAKVEEKLGLRKKSSRGWGPWRIFKSLFSTVIGSTFLSGCLIAIPLCVHYLWEVKDPTEHRQYVSDNIGAWFYFAAFNVLLSWYLAVLIDLAPLAVTGVITLLWGEVTEAMKVHVETYGVIKGWIKPIFYAAEMWGSWAVIFQQIYNLHSTTDDVPSRAPYTRRLYQVIEFLFFLMLIFCVCKILLQFIALSFHRVAFKDRLSEIEFNVAVLDRLNLYRPKIKKTYAQGGGTSGYTSSGAATPLKSLFTGAGRKVSPDQTKSAGKTTSRKGSWSEKSAFEKRFDEDGIERDGGHSYPPRQDLAEEEKKHGFEKFVGNVGKNVKRVALHDARNVKGKAGRAAEDELTSNLNSSKVAKNLARNIYKSYRNRKRAYLLPEDFYIAFDTMSAAEAAFNIFDTDGNGDISRGEIKTVVMKTYKERRFLAKALQDVDQAVGSLENVILFFGALILFFVALSIFGVKIGTQVTSLYTLLIGLSFIFKSAAGNAFDSIIFLFVTHPFDTGDRCFIGAENLVVKRMGIWSTNFVRVDGTEAYYYNSVLFSMLITNVRRSGPMFENMTVQVGWDTTNEQIDELEKRINNWLSQDEARDISSSTAIMVQHIDFQRSIELTIGIPHIPTWQDWGARMNRRTRFHAAAKFYMEQLDISWKNSVLPLKFVNANGTDAFPSAPTSAVDDAPLSAFPPSTTDASRKMSMSRFRRPSMGIPHPSKGRVEGDNNGGATEEPIKAALGFLPTPEERGTAGAHQLRRRKARSKKAAMMAGG